MVVNPGLLMTIGTLTGFLSNRFDLTSLAGEKGVYEKSYV